MCVTGTTTRSFTKVVTPSPIELIHLERSSEPPSDVWSRKKTIPATPAAPTQTVGNQFLTKKFGMLETSRTRLDSSPQCDAVAAPTTSKQRSLSTSFLENGPLATLDIVRTFLDFTASRNSFTKAAISAAQLWSASGDSAFFTSSVAFQCSLPTNVASAFSTSLRAFSRSAMYSLAFCASSLRGYIHSQLNFVCKTHRHGLFSSAFQYLCSADSTPSALTHVFIRVSTGRSLGRSSMRIASDSTSKYFIPPHHLSDEIVLTVRGPSDLCTR
mmetsp:Transcript_10399/g.31782  ORF Transcript_10399/g.31782 Transcript_10399/m.31782 type:complete len:271 (+) Transcript_10399:1540-2352(+)